MFYPRFKPGHEPVLFGDNEIMVGGGIPGIADVIRSPEPWLWPLFVVLDGTHSVDEVVTHLVRLFPGLAEADVVEAINDLVAAAHIENASVGSPLPVELREQHRAAIELYACMSRIPLRSGEECQQLLAEARVAVIGLGGVGCGAALILAMSGIGHLHCVDRDRVELSNLHRQLLYTRSDIGEFKVHAALRRLARHNPDITLTGEVLSIDGPDELSRLASECDVLLLTADRPAEIRAWANEACIATGTSWVHSGYTGPLTNIGVYRPGTGPCYGCGQLANRDKLAARPMTPWPPGVGVDRPHAANAVSVGIAGTYAALFVTSLLTGVPSLPVNREYRFNLVQPARPHSIRLPAPRVDCPACRS